jgi:hypothetical protein
MLTSEKAHHSHGQRQHDPVVGSHPRHLSRSLMEKIFLFLIFHENSILIEMSTQHGCSVE